MNVQPSDPLVAALATQLSGARWCGRAGRAPGAVTVWDVVPLPGAAALVLVDVTSDGERSRYVMPVDTAGNDSAAAPAVGRWLLDTVWGRATHAGGRGRVVGHTVGRPPALPAGVPDVSLLGTDASNTSCRVAVGNATFATKLIRRCRPGVQPEVEMGAFVAEQTSWCGTPRLCGWLDYEPVDGGLPTTLATVHEFAPGCDAAWDRLLELVQDGGLGGPQGARILAIVDAVAAVTAQMHAALAGRADIAAFAPVVPPAADRRAQAAKLAAHAAAVCDLLAEPIAGVTDALAARLRAVAARRADLVGRLAAIADVDAGAADIRVHGDFHLGQVLLTRDDRPLVIDFEGEPARPLDDRRMKTSACRDVAGMCRSLDYLLRCAARAGGPPSAAADATQLQRRYEAGYAAAVSGAPWWPVRPADAEALLAAYMLDKALYELAYELGNRPTWVEVPLAAVETLLAQPPARRGEYDRSGRPS